MFLLDFYLII